MPVDPTKFNVGQDRTIDPMTVQTYCTGCPFKKVAPRPRNGGGSQGGVPFESAGFVSAPMMKIKYVCSSPNYHADYKKRFSLEMSTIGFGYCPFLLEKWKLKESNTDPDDPPAI